MGNAVHLRLVPAFGEDLAVRDDADLAIVEILQQLLALSFGSAPWMTADVMFWALNASAIFVACSTSTQNATHCSRSNA